MSKSWRGDKRNSYQRGYGPRWQKARREFLNQHPLCCFCERQGKVVPASVVDHIQPHEGDQELFWDRTNWQALCHTCHSGTKQYQEQTGKVRGGNADGWPTDEGHHWNS